MTSHRQIFRTSAIIGSASLINIVIGIIKTKVLAVLLGPAGVGLMGVYQSIMSAASTFAGCGMETSGVRQIAISQGDKQILALVSRVLIWGNVTLGVLGMLMLWLAREPIAELVFHDITHASEVGWLGVGVLLSLLSSSQMAMLQGLRRIGDVARVNVLGSIVGTGIGILVIRWQGQDGVHWFVISAPFASAIFSSWYASRLQKVAVGLDWAVIRQQWQSMLSLGIPIMVAALLTVVTQLIARSLVMRNIGMDASGYFQAAWAISMTYIAFVLRAMGTDYLPRLTAAIHDKESSIKLVNEQTEMALLIAAPVLLAMLTLAPWLIELLYAKSFAPATEILRWQVMGDCFKVISWPMGFIVLAQGRGDVFIATQLNWNALYLLCLWFGMDEMGLLIAGVGFFVAYVVQAGLVRIVVGRLIGFTSQSKNLGMFAALLIAAGVILVSSEQNPIASLIVGSSLTLSYCCYSAWRLNQLVELVKVIKNKIGLGR